MTSVWFRLSRALEGLFFVALCVLALTYSVPRPQDETDRVRAYTRAIEFDYVSWMLDAARVKIQQSAAGIPGYLDRESSIILVSDYIQVTQRIIQAEDTLNEIYADPTITDKATASEHIRGELGRLYARQNELAPLAEGVLQAQVAQVAGESGLTTLGQPIPAVLFHSTSVPDALIVSPRSHVEQAANISIAPGLPIDQQALLEQRVEGGLDMSALVVPIGGVGVYPTMIMRTSDLNWLSSTIAHEWTHNYLELRPLGLLYDQSPELRTMNETTADIVGTEIGAAVIKRYYPLLQHSALPSLGLVGFPWDHPLTADSANPPFDFRAEMHTTRVSVDAMLASGRITEAEQYMEQRRQVFVQNGYFIRRLNQAYFAFYGAYADIPGGAAGEDPVGPAVRALRSHSRSLADFVNRIAWMTSFQQLLKAVGQ
jgi:hypothetical protein